MPKNPALLTACVIFSVAFGCRGIDLGMLLSPRDSDHEGIDGLTLVARIAHVSDTQIIDEETPARFAGAGAVINAAWRPYESSATQLFDGIIRAVNRIHAAGRPIDFLVHTGDACDNVQSNELNWVIGVFDGQLIQPLTGPDDRPPDSRPPAQLDPHAEFQAQGLYRNGRHGELPSIPWYIVFGNHDVHSIGVFPIVTLLNGGRVAPLPLPLRPGLVLPVTLDPLALVAYGNVTPARPGPPPLLSVPQPVTPNAKRAFFNQREFIRAMFNTVSEPLGHGFANPDTGPSWYSVSPLPGLRLIGLDTNDRSVVLPGFVYSEGAMTRRQFSFLRDELSKAAERGEIVIVASHHPSNSIDPVSGSEVRPEELRPLLNEFPNVLLHLVGHQHRNYVSDRGGYLEIETDSTLDPPQEGRLIEIWRDDVDGSLTVAYEMFSHLDDALPPLGDDPLRPLRVQAHALAQQDRGAASRQMRLDPSGAPPAGQPTDRRATVSMRRPE